jgi:hypothetical protein
LIADNRQVRRFFNYFRRYKISETRYNNKYLITLSGFDVNRMDFEAGGIRNLKAPFGVGYESKKVLAKLR